MEIISKINDAKHLPGQRIKIEGRKDTYEIRI